MVISTRSTRIRRIVEAVLRRLPARDQRTIGAFVAWVHCEREWKTHTFGSLVDPRAAALLPLTPVKEKRRHRHAHLVVSLPVCRLFSDAALTGILAHVFAHAVRAASRGTGWWQSREEHWQREEREAEALATRWGFASELRARTQERALVVQPSLEEHERGILALINRRRVSARP